MLRPDIPEFAILGHPNEGKSSVVSTLAEDDSVRVSSTPGETRECRSFPVVIDGKEVIRFVDTPGFQNPRQTLAWMKNFQAASDDPGSTRQMIEAFVQRHRGDPAFANDCELFTPVIRGAGILFVVDGSRPVRNADRAEMEILRLTGRPRMAIINNKADDFNHLEQWKNEFRKNFNAIRVFNAHTATYAQRIALLESLKSIDQDWEPALARVIEAFQKDWEHRIGICAETLCMMFAECLEFSISKSFSEKSDEKKVMKALQEKYAGAIRTIERRAHQQIRRLFKQNLFDIDLPDHSMLQEDLFSQQTWQVLGLSAKQLITAAGLAGGAMGAAMDAAAAGLTFGIFTAAGGVLGAGLAAVGGGKRLAKARISGLKLGGWQLTLGPTRDLRFFFILIDRSLLFFEHIINWAHGRRAYPKVVDKAAGDPGQKGFTAGWDNTTRRLCSEYFQAIKNSDARRKEIAAKHFMEQLKAVLRNISLGRGRSDKS